ncbi:uncharacterized protein LOC100825565 [Brachypodium distachyon]|uniref:uncharacterized protein LOC100825565 n=1 Tax=Brachypodium distachyon TaxID=15368 RepID=UPI0001C70113|nr:uncharacterized protein LOC100825565 [Brachypodium distachyon]|eukprot:XP_003580584.1 uncharacterized protein LOC100825565 [Brachypodium distachyon]
MAATRKPRSQAAAAGDHLRFLRPGALARLRDARLRRRKPASRPSPSPPPSPLPPSAPATAEGVGESGGPFVPYFGSASRLLSPRCPQRKKLTAAKGVKLFSPPPPSSDLPIEVLVDFLNASDMVVAAH